MMNGILAALVLTFAIYVIGKLATKVLTPSVPIKITRRRVKYLKICNKHLSSLQPGKPAVMTNSEGCVYCRKLMLVDNGSINQ